MRTFEQNIRGHAFNALTMALRDDEWMPLSRRKEIADAIGDAILGFLAPVDADGKPLEVREIPLARRPREEVRARILSSSLPPELAAALADGLAPDASA